MMHCSISPLWTRGTEISGMGVGFAPPVFGLPVPFVPVAGELAVADDRGGAEGGQQTD